MLWNIFFANLIFAILPAQKVNFNWRTLEDLFAFELPCLRIVLNGGGWEVSNKICQNHEHILWRRSASDREPNTRCFPSVVSHTHTEHTLFLLRAKLVAQGTRAPKCAAECHAGARACLMAFWYCNLYQIHIETTNRHPQNSHPPKKKAGFVGRVANKSGGRAFVWGELSVFRYSSVLRLMWNPFRVSESALMVERTPCRVRRASALCVRVGAYTISNNWILICKLDQTPTSLSDTLSSNFIGS